MDNEIKHIQNELWAMYRQFVTDFNVKKYTNQATNLCRKYKDNKILLNFCQNLVVTWTPIINHLAEIHRNEVA